MKLEVGKYYTFGGKGSYIVGPMVVNPYDRSVLKCASTGESFYKETGNSYYGHNTLVEEVILPETAPMSVPARLGMALMDLDTNGVWYVNYTRRFNGFDVRGYESSTSSSYRGFVRLPALDVCVEVPKSQYARVGNNLVSGVTTYFTTSQGAYPTHVSIGYSGTDTLTGRTKCFQPEEVVQWFEDHPFKAVDVGDLNLQGKFITMEAETFPDSKVENTLSNGGLWVRYRVDGAYWFFWNFRENDSRSVYVHGITRGWVLKAHDELLFNDPVADEFPCDAVTPSYDVSALVGALMKVIPDDELRIKFRLRAMLTGFRQATQNRSNLALYLNQKQRETQRIQSLRPGRAIRALLPEATDALIEKMVDCFRKNFPTAEYAIKRGFEAENFKHMYAHTMVNMQNPRTTSSRKSLGNSCMRHAENFRRLPHHPAEAYASGEFEAIWTENSDGRIASRLVVWHPPEGHRLHGKPQCGPVYGTCEYSIDLLEEAAVAMGADLYEEATWAGAKWQKLPYDGGVIAPYSDHEQSVEDCGTYLKLGGDCDYEAHTYSGVLGARENSYMDCDECGVNIDTDYDEYYHTDHHGCICQSCHDRLYFYCEDYEEDRPRDEMCEVYRTGPWRGGQRRFVCEAARDENYTFCVDDEQYWDNDDVTILANGDAISPSGRASGDYAECSVTEEWYPVEDMYPLVNGGYVAKENFDETTQALNDQGEVYEREAA